MKASDLVTIWSAPVPSRLTSKQYSFRLPVDVAAKLAAFEELYPSRTRTQIVGDLLSAAIAVVEENLPASPGRLWGEDPDDGEKLYLATGPVMQFRTLVNKHYEAIERDMGNESPAPLYGVDLLVKADDK